MMFEDVRKMLEDNKVSGLLAEAGIIVGTDKINGPKMFQLGNSLEELHQYNCRLIEQSASSMESLLKIVLELKEAVFKDKQPDWWRAYQIALVVLWKLQGMGRLNPGLEENPESAVTYSKVLTIGPPGEVLDIKHQGIQVTIPSRMPNHLIMQAMESIMQGLAYNMDNDDGLLAYNWEARADRESAKDGDD